MADELGFHIQHAKDEWTQVANHTVVAGDEFIELSAGGEILVVENLRREAAV